MPMNFRFSSASDTAAIIGIHRAGLATGHASFRIDPYHWNELDAECAGVRGLALVAEEDAIGLAWADVMSIPLRMLSVSSESAFPRKRVSPHCSISSARRVGPKAHALKRAIESAIEPKTEGIEVMSHQVTTPRTNDVSLVADSESITAVERRQRACSELLRQADIAAGLLDVLEPAPQRGVMSAAASAAIEPCTSAPATVPAFEQVVASIRLVTAMQGFATALHPTLQILAGAAEVVGVALDAGTGMLVRRWEISQSSAAACP